MVLHLISYVFFVLPCLAFDHEHTLWKSFVNKYVEQKGSVSKVDYKTIRAEKKVLQDYLDVLTKSSISEYPNFNENQKLTFLMNAYNAFTLKLIIEHYPVKSIKDIGSLFKSPWNKKFYMLFNEEKTLNNIEHDVIRKQFNEPRIHLALVCASKGCPGLRWYGVSDLEKQLESVTITYLKDPERNKYSPGKNELKISNIFKWYQEDFDKKFGSVKGFIAPRIAKDEDEKKAILSQDTKIGYFDYDWTLNDKSK